MIFIIHFIETYPSPLVSSSSASRFIAGAGFFILSQIGRAAEARDRISAAEKAKESR